MKMKIKNILFIILIFLASCEKNEPNINLKPDNILLEKSGYIKLADFGISKYIIRDNSNDASGTPGYCGEL